MEEPFRGTMEEARAVLAEVPKPDDGKKLDYERHLLDWGDGTYGCYLTYEDINWVATERMYSISTHDWVRVEEPPARIVGRDFLPEDAFSLDEIEKAQELLNE